MIQGYGKLYSFDDVDGDILNDELDYMHEKIISSLIDFEKPTLKIESLDYIIEQSVYCKYISKNILRRILMERKNEILAKHKLLAEDENFFDEE